MKNTTVVQELIEWVTEIENSVSSLTFEEKDFKLLKQFKEKFISKLEKEKQQISQAFDFGFDRDDMSGDEYYSNTYKTVSE